jgi:hypothetical protein
MDAGAGHPTSSPRPWLVASLVLLALLLSSTALPWFTSAETSQWGPLSHRLDLGWAPGTQDWGFLVLALGAAAVIAAGIALVAPKRAPRVVLLVLASALVVATLLELNAHLSVNPGPNLHADYGAWVGGAAAVLAWIGVAVVTYLAQIAA